MKTRCGALAAERLPIAGRTVSWRVRPCVSRAVLPVLVCTIRLPSASVCTDSLPIVALYGVDCTGVPCARMAPPPNNATCPTGPPLCKITVLPPSCAKAQDEAARIRMHEYFTLEFFMMLVPPAILRNISQVDLRAQFHEFTAAGATVAPIHPPRWSRRR